MIKMLIMLTPPIMMSMIMIMLYQTINKKTIMERNKMMPFECGFDPKSSSRIPFSTQFFLIGILFLIFDVEMVIMLPMIITLKSSNIIMWVTMTTTFITILIVGLYYEWKNGVLEWIN
uniref:NADH-ubiquinone oxidoreductase chain 3 n=1 Tax=Tingis cardui TaxID=1511256 RepID=A0A343WNQ5_9HEMI|nr:NADH dehydrogenase subunit 3 [Tingis cardui]AWD31631.1 NADH dehydrogenase subunit 3 [Tingis cardui]